MAHKRANQMFSPRSPDNISYTPGAIYARSSTKPKILEETKKRMMQIRKFKFKHGQPESLMDFTNLQVVGGSRRLFPATTINQTGTRNLLIPKRNPEGSQLQLRQSSVDELMPQAQIHANIAATKASLQHRFRPIHGMHGLARQVDRSATETSLPELHKHKIRLHPVAAGREGLHLAEQRDEEASVRDGAPAAQVEEDTSTLDKEQLWKRFLEQHANASRDGVAIVEGKGGRGKIREDTLQYIIFGFDTKTDQYPPQLFS